MDQEKFKMKKILLISLFLSSCTSFKEKNIIDYYEISKKCGDIACIRNEIDEINFEILQLLTKRTAYVKRAGDIKYALKKIADDKDRVSQQEEKIIHESNRLGLPVEISVSAFREIVQNSIKFEQKYIDSKNNEPAF